MTTSNPFSPEYDPPYEEEDPHIRQAQCDCCGKMVDRDQISRLIAYGIETYACDECRGWDDDDGLSPEDERLQEAVKACPLDDQPCSHEPDCPFRRVCAQG